MELSEEEAEALKDFISELAHPQSVREFLEGYCDDMECMEGLKEHPLRKVFQKLGLI